jgi:hypothetical protein
MTLLAALLLSAALGQEAPAPSPAPEAHGTAPADHSASAEHGAASGGHAEEGPSEILMHHVLDQPFAPFGVSLGPSKHLVFFVIAGGLVILLAQLARRSYAAGGVPTGLRRRLFSTTALARPR